MKVLKLSAWIILSLSILIFTACGGGGGGGSNPSGEVTMSITDAKPLLPEGAEQATNLWVTFTEVLVHKSGGGWISLPLAESPYTIDLLYFSDGFTTELVPPVSLESGKYTQIRLVVSHADISFNNGETGDPVEVPSEHLKTDKNFTFDVPDGGAVDITVDFDLSQSIVVTDDGLGTLSYKLKPVLHIVDTFEAATINGKIAYDSFVGDQEAEVTASVCTDNTFVSCETYTQLKVSREATVGDPTEFSIFWLIPDEYYRVEIDFDPDDDNGPDYDEDVIADDLEPGEVFELNGGGSIIFPQSA